MTVGRNFPLTLRRQNSRTSSVRVRQNSRPRASNAPLGSAPPFTGDFRCACPFYRWPPSRSNSLGNCPNGGFLSDTDDNAADFIFADTNGTNAGAGQRLGAPGPQNITSPIQRNSLLPGSLISPCVSASAPPNRARDFTADVPNNSNFGTLSVRRRLTNNTGTNVTRLCFRVIDISTFKAPTGTADLRLRSSPVIIVTDACTSLPMVIQGTLLEEPPTQPNGGGFNSSLSAYAVTLATPILPGGTFNFHFLLGIQQTGSFKLYVNIEALP